MTKTHQVRNGATLAFAALLTKVVGYMNAANPAAGGASRRAVAGDEFFRRFPATHPFLLAELTEAAERLESQTDGAVHPALYPILALLSRLRPSSGAPARESARRLKDTKANKGEPPDGDDGDRREIEGSGAGAGADLDLDPAAFAPAVRRCARGRVHAVRAAAARALAPLIRAQDVARALAETFRDAAAFGDDWTSSVSPPSGTSRVSSRARRPQLGYNAAHGACCARPSCSGLRARRRRARRRTRWRRWRRRRRDCLCVHTWRTPRRRRWPPPPPHGLSARTRRCGWRV